MFYDVYIYTLVWGYIYIHIYIFLDVCMVCLSVSGLHVFLVFGFWMSTVLGFGKNKLRLSALMKLYFSFSQKEAESSF